MRALVISGGGSKGAFAGGVAQHLIQDLERKYDMFIGTSTGSLLVSHLALSKISEIKEFYTSVNQSSIFKNCPFIIKKKRGYTNISINHFNVLRNLIGGKKSFGNSENLRDLVGNAISIKDFEKLKASNTEVIVTVTNLSANVVEYKSLKDCSYTDFLDWIWISCNYPPFMSLVRKNSCDYVDGGLGSMVPIREAIRRGAKELDVIVLETEVNYLNRMPTKNPFSLITNMVDFMMDKIEHQNIQIGKFEAKEKDVSMDLYYTPTVLTTNSLVFDKDKMTEWWAKGYEFAKQKNISNPI
ncbi:patatin-like phospholipase family protein [Aquimarina sp. AD10]|uniref:patatin-like phospholipase family protein n=1 Tax=Aquimarina sp. AD10 TaxID=1714849 RepID=UPI000E47E70E|nr:patatin-like phospholipase family protein [Aquimarina sp. AD10]AXT59303.1 patatin-like phospholipase family protein [Aquimarina sp. AD10]RKM95190.1 patatin-like phospholipase family protein [Aquimarina sp. AD10]